MAEVMTYWEGLSWIKNRRLTTISLESDLANAIAALSRKLKDHSYTGAIIDNCYTIMACF